jgi:hypothetical protein
VSNRYLSVDDVCSRLEVTREQLAAMFMSHGEAAAALQVSTQRLDQLTARDGEPTPVATTKAGKIYLVGDIRRYAEARGRAIPDTSE